MQDQARAGEGCPFSSQAPTSGRLGWGMQAVVAVGSGWTQVGRCAFLVPPSLQHDPEILTSFGLNFSCSFLPLIWIFLFLKNIEKFN